MLFERCHTNTGLPTNRDTGYSDTGYSDISVRVTLFWSKKGSYTENPGHSDILLTVTLFAIPTLSLEAGRHVIE